jgi:hypothetical protein
MKRFLIVFVLLVLEFPLLAKDIVSASFFKFSEGKVYIKLTNLSDDDLLISSHEFSDSRLLNNIGFSIQYWNGKKIKFLEHGRVISPPSAIRYMVLPKGAFYTFTIKIEDLSNAESIASIAITFTYCSPREFHLRNENPGILKLFSSQVLSRISDLKLGK